MLPVAAQTPPQVPQAAAASTATPSPDAIKQREQELEATRAEQKSAAELQAKLKADIAVQPHRAFGGAPENDAGLGGLPGQAQERRRRDSDSQGRLKNEALTMEKKLQQLTVEERIKLVEDLWDSIAADQGALPITADQRIELDRRLNTYAVDKNRGRPAAEAVRDIRRRL
jgi:putative addiction module component (TIGR02574 family)